MDNWIEFLVPMVTQCPQDVGMTRRSISTLTQPSVSTLPQLNQLITYRWVIVHAAHGMIKGSKISSNFINFMKVQKHSWKLTMLNWHMQLQGYSPWSTWWTLMHKNLFIKIVSFYHDELSWSFMNIHHNSTKWNKVKHKRAAPAKWY